MVGVSMVATDLMQARTRARAHARTRAARTRIQLLGPAWVPWAARVPGRPGCVSVSSDGLGACAGVSLEAMFVCAVCTGALRAVAVPHDAALGPAHVPFRRGGFGREAPGQPARAQRQDLHWALHGVELRAGEGASAAAREGLRVGLCGGGCSLEGEG
eukprot:1656662-Prymnesium_polylepis.1